VVGGDAHHRRTEILETEMDLGGGDRVDEPCGPCPRWHEHRGAQLTRIEVGVEAVGRDDQLGTVLAGQPHRHPRHAVPERRDQPQHALVDHRGDDRRP